MQYLAYTPHLSGDRPQTWMVGSSVTCTDIDLRFLLQEVFSFVQKSQDATVCVSIAYHSSEIFYVLSAVSTEIMQNYVD